MATSIERYGGRSGLYGVAFGAGILGAVIMTVLVTVCRAIGWTPMNLELSLGSLITQDMGAGTWLLGFGMHLLFGGLFGVVYASIFKAMRRSGSGVGATIGFFHWLIAGVVLAVMPAIHPLIPEVIAAPGWFAANAGFFTMLLVLAEHLIYGAVVGGIYHSSVRSMRVKRPEEPADLTRAA